MSMTVRAARRSAVAQAVLALALLSAAAGEACAVVKGTSSSLGAHVVRVHSGHYCSGVAIARRAIVTAAHCVSRRTLILAGGVSIAVAGVARNTTLDEGRRVTVTGDAAIVTLAAPLPSAIVPVPVGEGEGDSYTIAGYGTPSESRRTFGVLREARLVAAEPRALVDPNRTGSIGASACHGDSGGPVLRGSALIGVITRAAHPHPRIACGHLTRSAPIVVSGTAVETAAVAVRDSAAVQQRRPLRHKLPAGKPVATAKRVTGAVGDFVPVPIE